MKHPVKRTVPIIILTAGIALFLLFMSGCPGFRQTGPTPRDSFRLETRPPVSINPQRTAVTTLAISPGGKLFAGGHRNGNIIIGNTEGEVLLTLQGHRGAVLSVAFSPDGKILASGGEDTTVRIWDAKTGSLLGVLEGSLFEVFSVAFSPDGKILASGGGDDFIRLWDYREMKPIQILRGHIYAIHSIAFSPDGRFLAAGCYDDTISLWDAESFGRIEVLTQHQDQAWQVAFSPDSHLLVAGCEEGGVFMWDTSGDRAIPAGVIPPGPWGQALQVVFTGNRTLGIIGNKKESFFHKVPEGDKLYSYQTKEFIESSAVDHARGLMLLGMRDGSIHFFNISDPHESPPGEPIVRKPIPSGVVPIRSRDIISQTIARGNMFFRDYDNALEGHRRALNDGSISPDGSLAVTASDDGTARLWQVNDGRLLHILKGHRGQVVSSVFAGNIVVTGGMDGTLRMWDPAQGSLKRTFSLPGGDGIEVNALEPVKEGSLVAVASSGGEIFILDPNIGSLKNRIRLQDSYPTGLKAGPGNLLASGTNMGEVIVLNYQKGNILKTINASSLRIRAVAISPDGDIIAGGGDEAFIGIWRAGDGTLIRRIPVPLAVTGLAFSKDGRYLTASTQDRLVRVYDIQNDWQVGYLEWHIFNVNRLRFSPRGNQLITVSGDLCARLWDFPQCLQKARKEPPHDCTLPPGQGSFHKVGPIIKIPTGAPLWVAVSPDGNLVATGSDDGRVYVMKTTDLQWFEPLEGHRDEVTAGAFLNNKRLITGSADETLRIWDAENGRCAKVLEGKAGSVTGLEVIPGRNLVTAGYSTGKVLTWNTETPEIHWTIKDHRGRITGIATDPKGRYLATGDDDDRIFLWDIEKRSRISSLVQYRAFGIVLDFSPCGEFLSSGAGSCVIEVLSIPSLARKTKILAYKWRVTSVRFSPDGSILASGSFDRNISLWNPKTGDYIDVLRGHSSEITGLAFHPEGKWLVSSSDDGTLRFWELLRENKQPPQGERD